MLSSSFQRLYRAAAVGTVAGALTWLAWPQEVAQPDQFAVSTPDLRRVGSRATSAPDLFESARGDVSPAVSPVLVGAPTLQGLSVSAGRVRALVSVGDGKPIWLTQGQIIGEWTFIGMTQGDARFESPAQLLVLRPFQNETAPPLASTE